MFLDEIETVDDDLNRESVTWRDQTFSRSLTNPLSGCSEIGPVDWVIPVGYGFFDAEIGVAEDAAEPDASVTFNVYVDGDPVVSETLTVGQHQPLRVPLSEASRIRLETIIDQNRRGNCNTEATSVFGDARFTN
nr:NPCBM/NEW2 domain-containing protein [Ornithinimicrobium cryptoxanthini]